MPAYSKVAVLRLNSATRPRRALQVAAAEVEGVLLPPRMADEVSAWVATLAAPGATAARLPEGLRAESIDFLRRLARASVRRDAAERGLAHDAERRAEQHQVAAAEVEGVLQQCGLAPDSLPASVTGSLDTLASAAVALGTRDASLGSLYAAIDALEREQAETRQAVQSELQLCDVLRARFVQSDGLLQQLAEVQARCQENAHCQAAESEARTRDLAMLEKKSAQYKQDIALLKEQLKRNGVSEKIYHSKLLQESQAVLNLHQQLVPLRASVEVFQGLPSDLRAAKQVWVSCAFARFTRLSFPGSACPECDL